MFLTEKKPGMSKGLSPPEAVSSAIFGQDGVIGVSYAVEPQRLVAELTDGLRFMSLSFAAKGVQGGGHEHDVLQEE